MRQEAKPLFGESNSGRGRNDSCVPLIIDRSKSQTGAADFNSYITRQLQGRLDPRVPLDVYHHRSMENLGLQATDLFA